jgi:PAS domain S-box-containing protein
MHASQANSMASDINYRKSEAADASGRGPTLECPTRSIWTYARPAVVLAVGLAFSTYCAWAVAESAQRQAGVEHPLSFWRGPCAILLGGCVLTLVAVWCSRPLGGGWPTPRQNAGPVACERRDRVAALREKVELLSQIIQSTSIPLFVINQQHVVIHWNRACENLTGVRAHEIIGTPEAWRAFYAAERPVLAELVVDRRPQEEIAERYGSHASESAVLPGAYEIEALFPNFGEGGKWLFFTAAPLHDATGAIIGAIETFQDTTERKRAEAALRESEEKFREIAEATGDWIWKTDESGVYTYASARVRDILGYAPEEVLGKTPFDFMPGDEAGRVAAVARPLMEARRPYSLLENKNLHKDGREVILETSGAPVFDSAGHFRGYRGVDRDVTERKRAEDELQRRVNELSEAKQRLEVLVSNTTDRERRMVDLKREVNDLLETLGRGPKYEGPQKVAEFMASTRASTAR